MTVYLKVNYKVLLLFAVIFDLFHLSVDELVARAIDQIA
jgi:hypothetical protein